VDVRDQVVVVTGGASGIGRAMCRAFAAAGAAAVVVADVNGDGAEVVAAELSGRGRAVRTDVSSQSDVVALVESVQRDYGRIDLFC